MNDDVILDDVITMSYDLHFKLNHGFYRLPVSLQRGPAELLKPRGAARSTANYGLRAGLRCFFGKNKICLAGRAARDHYFKTAIWRGSCMMTVS